jgi:hypothetical protein
MTCKDASVDEEGQCYKDERDKIFSRMRLSTNLIKLQTLRCCYCFFLSFGAMKFRGRNFYKKGRKESDGLVMMMGGLSRLDKLENVHVSTPSFKKVWVRKDYTIHTFRGSGSDLTIN